MAIRRGDFYRKAVKKKTIQGTGVFTKYGHKGGGPNGSTKSKCYKKKSKGQGKRR